MPTGIRATGGRYTRPRRGFRARSHYRARLKDRGLTREDVKMEPLYVLRKRQGFVPGSTNRTNRKRRANSAVRSGDTGIQMPVSDVASYDLPPEWEDFYKEAEME